MEIKEIILNALNDMDFEKIIGDKVQECVKSTLENCIDSIYGSSYGDFGVVLKNEIKKQIGLNLDIIKLPQYNLLIEKSINKVINQNIENTFNSSVNKLTSKMFMTDLSETYDLSYLLEQFKNTSEYQDDDDQMSLYIEKKYDSIIVYFDSAESCPDYSCHYRMFIESDGTIFSLKIKNKDLDDCVFDGNNFDSLLTNIFLQGKKIIFDMGKDSYNYDLDYHNYD